MKNLLLTAFVSLMFIGQILAGGAPCAIDSSITDPGFYPMELPCVERTVPYDTSIQLYNYSTVDAADFGIPFPVTVTVNWVRVDSITGLPSGLGYACNPSNCTFPGGSRGCINLSGTTSAPVGEYPLVIYATINADVPGLGNQEISGTTDDLGFSFSLSVVNTGDPCPLPSVVVDDQPLITCPGVPANINPVIDTGGAIAPLTFAWSPATGLSDTSILNPVASPTVNTTYTLTVTDNNGFEFTTTVDVEIDNTPAPVAAFSFVDSNGVAYFTNISSNGTSYTWTFGDGSGSTQASPSNSYATGGSYDVTLIANNNCGSDTITQSITVTAIRTLSVDLGVKVYPNPGNGTFVVTAGTQGGDNLNMTVINMAGQQVYTGTIKPGKQEVDLSSLNQGVYFVRVEAEQGNQVIKLIIQ